MNLPPKGNTLTGIPWHGGLEVTTMLLELTIILGAVAFVSGILGFGAIAAGAGAIAGYLLVLLLTGWETGWPSQPHMSSHFRSTL